MTNRPIGDDIFYSGQASACSVLSNPPRSSGGSQNTKPHPDDEHRSAFNRPLSVSGGPQNKKPHPRVDDPRDQNVLLEHHQDSPSVAALLEPLLSPPELKTADDLLQENHELRQVIKNLSEKLEAPQRRLEMPPETNYLGKSTITGNHLSPHHHQSDDDSEDSQREKPTFEDIKALDGGDTAAMLGLISRLEEQQNAVEAREEREDIFQTKVVSLENKLKRLEQRVHSSGQTEAETRILSRIAREREGTIESLNRKIGRLETENTHPEGLQRKIEELQQILLEKDREIGKLVAADVTRQEYIKLQHSITTRHANEIRDLKAKIAQRDQVIHKLRHEKDTQRTASEEETGAMRATQEITQDEFDEVLAQRNNEIVQLRQQTRVLKASASSSAVQPNTSLSTSRKRARPEEPAAEPENQSRSTGLSESSVDPSKAVWEIDNICKIDFDPSPIPREVLELLKANIFTWEKDGNRDWRRYRPKRNCVMMYMQSKLSKWLDEGNEDVKCDRCTRYKRPCVVVQKDEKLLELLLKRQTGTAFAPAELGYWI